MAKKNGNKEINKKELIFWLMPLILIIISIIINRSTFIRPVLVLISILLIIIKFNCYKKKSIIGSFVIFIILMFIMIVIDNVVVMTFKTIPIFSYNIINYENIRIYNSVGLRVWQCDKDNYKDLKVDLFYNRGYLCDVNDTDAMDINSFLNAVVENYNYYSNRVMKIGGKISKKNSRNMIELKSYETNSITVNGYVNFSDNILLRVIFNEEEVILDDYDVYDDIEVIGIIKNMEKEDNRYVIYMSDSKVVSDIGLDSYTLSITPSVICKDKKEIFNNDNMNVYMYCLEDIIIDYGSKKYELSLALSSGKLKIHELYEFPNNEQVNELGDTLYFGDSYNVLVCNIENSKDIIIGNDKMNFDDVVCSRKNVE